MLRHWSEHLGGAEPERLELTAWGSLPAAWSARWRVHPHDPVIRDPGGRWMDAHELSERSAAVAGRLRRAGARPGDRVVMAATASNALVVAHCAALRAGLVVVPLNPAATRRELEVLLGDARPRVAVLGPRSLSEWAAAIDRELVVTSPEVTLEDGPVPALDGPQPDHVAMIIYTSGTTGAPKGAALSHANLLAGAQSVRLAWEWAPEDRLILCLPLCHVHGLCIGLHGSLLSGGAALLLERFDTELILDACEAGATLFFGVPTMYQRLIEAERPERLGRLRLCVCGSAPLSVELHHHVAERCGQVVLERYGMTETLLTVSNPLRGERRAGTVGFPLPGVELRLDERSSEILVRGPSVFAGYRAAPETNAAAFEEGWFRTGDIGQLDDGYLRIVGRARELIISGGYNVYPREVEDVLRAFAHVRDAAVVGRPSAQWGEEVIAFVEADEQLDVAALAQHAAAELAFYKRPRALHRVDELPRNLLGKVLKERLGGAPTSS
ncbi:MAG TPA: AMP-binding protein [Solirubrobacteraceae bacterium]|nr:AMP-binding protein [Solirubrobacteraceae bacterium]